MTRLLERIYRIASDRQATLFVTAFTIVSYGVALLRERANAAAYGTSAELDAYLVASSAISLIAITPSRALYEGLVLTIASHREREPDLAAATARAAVGLGVLVLAGLTAFGLLVVPALAHAIAPDMAPDRMAEVQRISVLLLPSIVGLGLWEITRGALHGFQEFFRSSVVPIIAPLVTFVMVTTLSGSIGIDALVWGSIAGASAQALVAVVMLVRREVRLTLTRDLVDARLLRVMTGPVAASATLAALAMLWVAADRFLASSLPEGRIAALNYASRISDVASIVAVTGIATVAFPQLARSARAARGAEFSRLLKKSVLETALGALPLTIVFVALARPVVHLLLGAGRFDAESERVTTEALIAYMIFLPLTAPAAVIARSVYALGMLRLLVAQGAVVLLAKIAIGLILRDPFQHIGVAVSGGLATMIGATVVLVAAVRAARDLTLPEAVVDRTIPESSP